MRRIHAGHVYDSEKARLIGTVSKGEGPDAKGSWPPASTSEGLYRTKAGLYFVYGRGGCASRYAVNEDGVWRAGESLFPLSPAQAESWAKAHLAEDEWNAEFNSSDDEPRALSVMLPGSVYRRIRDAAAKRGCSMAQVIVDAFNTQR